MDGSRDNLEASVADTNDTGEGGAPWGGKQRRERDGRPARKTGRRFLWSRRGRRGGTRPPEWSKTWGEAIAGTDPRVEGLPQGDETSGVTPEDNGVQVGDGPGQGGDENSPAIQAAAGARLGQGKNTKRGRPGPEAQPRYQGYGTAG